MSRIATLSILFESQIAEARRAYDDFAAYVENRKLKIPVEWQGPSSGAPTPSGGGTPPPSAPTTTFGGLAVPFVAASASAAAIIARPLPANADTTAPALATRTLTDAFAAAIETTARRLAGVPVSATGLRPVPLPVDTAGVSGFTRTADETRPRRLDSATPARLDLPPTTPTAASTFPQPLATLALAQAVQAQVGPRALPPPPSATPTSIVPVQSRTITPTPPVPPAAPPQAPAAPPAQAPAAPPALLPPSLPQRQIAAAPPPAILLPPPPPSPAGPIQVVAQRVQPLVNVPPPLPVVPVPPQPDAEARRQRRYSVGYVAIAALHEIARDAASFGEANDPLLNQRRTLSQQLAAQRQNLDTVFSGLLGGTVAGTFAGLDAAAAALGSNRRSPLFQARAAISGAELALQREEDRRQIGLGEERQRRRRDLAGYDTRTIATSGAPFARAQARAEREAAAEYLAAGKADEERASQMASDLKAARNQNNAPEVERIQAEMAAFVKSQPERTRAAGERLQARRQSLAQDVEVITRENQAGARGLDLSAQADEMRQQGNGLAAAFAEIAAHFQPVIDTLDKSAPAFQQRLDALNRQRMAAETSAVQAEQRQRRIVQGNIEAAQLELRRQPLEAALAQNRAQTEAELQGIAPFIPSGIPGVNVLNPQFAQTAQLGQLTEDQIRQERADERDRIQSSLGGRGRVLGALLRDDQAGAQVEEIRARYAQEQLGFHQRGETEFELQSRALEIGELKNFEKAYGRSFRGIEISPLNFDPTNARDVEDPQQVFDKIKDALKEAAGDMGQEIANRMATLLSDN